jgi:hypothetical protein
MKGQTKIELNGEEISLKFTLGVIEDLQAWAKANDVKDPDTDPKGQRVMFALMEIYAGDDWMSEDVTEKAEKESLKYKALGIDQIQKMMDMVDEASLGKAMEEKPTP